MNFIKKHLFNIAAVSNLLIALILILEVVELHKELNLEFISTLIITITVTLVLFILEKNLISSKYEIKEISENQLKNIENISEKQIDKIRQIAESQLERYRKNLNEYDKIEPYSQTIYLNYLTLPVDDLVEILYSYSRLYKELLKIQINYEEAFDINEWLRNNPSCVLTFNNVYTGNSININIGTDGIKIEGITLPKPIIYCASALIFIYISLKLYHSNEKDGLDIEKTKLEIEKLSLENQKVKIELNNLTDSIRKDEKKQVKIANSVKKLKNVIVNRNIINYNITQFNANGEIINNK